MNYIEAPEIYTGQEKSLFVAGGISNCPDWQRKFISYFKEKSITLINPRRYNFDVTDPSIEEEQIMWEHEHLERSDYISFWFPKETLCPITLYELGKYAMGDKKIFVGTDSNYTRKRDVEIQMKLVRPEMVIHNSLEELTEEIKQYLPNL